MAGSTVAAISRPTASLPEVTLPAAYDYTPNTFQLDQAVVYFERLPDTVQTDHIDWGFRFSGDLRRELPIHHGVRHRELSAPRPQPHQRLRHADDVRRGLHPQVAEGLLTPGRALHLAAGHRGAARAQQLHVHPLLHLHVRQLHQPRRPGSTLALNKNWFFQLGVSVGTDTAPWHWGQKVPNPFPNTVFPDTTMLRDPGAKPSVTIGARWQTRQRPGQHLRGRQCDQRRHLGLQQSPVVRHHLVSFVQFAVALLVGDLRAQPAESPQRLPIPPASSPTAAIPFTAQNEFGFNAPGFAHAAVPTSRPAPRRSSPR